MMELLVGTAWAQEAVAATPEAGWSVMLFSYLPIVAIFAIFYFLILRPQNQAAKAHAELVKGLKRGDVVLLDGGVIAEVVQVKDQIIHLRAAAGTFLTAARASVKKVLSADEAKGWEYEAPASGKSKR